MQDNHEYHYFAFISYSSKDKAFANKIYKELNSYRLPSILRNELEAANGKKYPQGVSPLFLDTNNLPVAHFLGESIRKELNDSRFLLVICSPNSAKSEWVNQEVENFILMGRLERIILFIIKGVPNSGNPKTECFPPILRKKRVFITYSSLSNKETADRHANLHALLDPITDELKGVSLSDEGYEMSRIKIIASMLEIRPDVLAEFEKKQREQEKQLQKQQRMKQKKAIPWGLFFAIFLITLFSYLGFRIWNLRSEGDIPSVENLLTGKHIGYYADYVEKNGVPEGIYPLSPEQWAHRNSHYRIYKQNKLVTKLEHVNSAGTPIPETNAEFQDRPIIAAYSYQNDNGNLVQRDILDNNGKIIMSNYYSGDNLQKMTFRYFTKNNKSSIKKASNVSLESLFDFEQSLGKTDNAIGNIRFERDSNGFVKKALFKKGIYDVPAVNEQGIAGYQYILDESGRIKDKIYLDQDGIPNPDKQGVVRISYKYIQENLVEIQLFYKDNMKISDEPKPKCCINTFESGNLTTKRIVDTSGKICQTINYEYNDKGYLTKVANLNFDGAPCLNKDGYATVTLEYHDKLGVPVERTYQDENNNPCLNKDNVAKIQWKYDERGSVIEEAYFGIDNKPCLCKEGYSKLINRYNTQGNESEQAFFDIDNQPCLCNEGYAKNKIEYDSQGNIISEAFFGIDNKPCLCKEGYAKNKIQYDTQGNIISEAFFDIDNHPCLCNDGYATSFMKYDKLRNLIEVAYFDIAGKPCLYMDSFAKVHFKYDEVGHIIGYECFDANNRPLHIMNDNSLEFYVDINDNPCMEKDAVFKKVTKTDEQGKVLEIAYYDLDGKPCLYMDGFAKRTIKYDEQGNVNELAYFGVDGKPRLNKDGYARVTFKYDEHGNKTEVDFLDLNDKPCLCDEGYAKISAKYDKQGNKTEEAYFGIDDKPCMNKDGLAKIMFKYDEQGNLEKINCYDINGEELPVYVSVQEISPGSNSEKYGILAGDVFILYDGQPVENCDSFVEMRSKETGNDPHELVILRENEFITIQIHPGLLGCSLEMKAISEDQQKLVSEKLKEKKSN
ncbi:MAG: TIR domain-containing protein [Thermoguttaceae bacterium]|nr:TIR domain-containing protein [Thermoguttaceae bacterium]